jgi:hypothetical protein
MAYSIRNEIAVAVVTALLLLALAISVSGTPVGPQIEYLGNKTKDIASGTARPEDERGTIVTVRFNVTQQSLLWKAYVGNVSGRITLEDSDDYSIFDWPLTSSGGEVYATRKSTAVDWENIRCAQVGHVENETLFLNQSIGKSDSLNTTFRANNHSEFDVGSVNFPTNACNHTAYTNVNSSSQKGDFGEILLYDTTTIIYTTIMNDSILGYDEGSYDFQMLIGEKGQEGTHSPIPYYFFVELT